MATDAELVAEGVERAIPGLITAAMTAIQAVRQGSHEKWVVSLEAGFREETDTG